MSALLKNILFALALAFILWLGYKLFFATDTTSLTTQNVEVITEASQDTQQFLRTLQQLRNITLNEALFNDPRFQSLEDHRQVIVPELTGRQNPFAPVGR